MRRLSVRPVLALALVLLASPALAADINITLPNVSAIPGGSVNVPIVLSGPLAGLNVTSIDFRLAYTPTIVFGGTAGTDGIIQNWGPPFANFGSGFFAEAAAGDLALTLPGTLLNTVRLTVQPNAVPGAISPLTFQHITFNNGTPTVAVVAGSVTVLTPAADVAPTAATGLALRLLDTPARSEARFDVSVPAGGQARLEVYDVRGRRVAALADALSPGPHTLAWDLRDAGGARVAAGLYFARLDRSGSSLTRKLLVAN